jgi:transcription elongation factor Elf1
MADSSYIYTVKKVVFSIDGTVYDASTIAIRASLNAIPEFIVGIAHKPSEGVAARTYVHDLSIDELAQTYSDLQKKAIDLATCNLDIELEQGGRAFPEGTLHLSGWLLKNVGMSHITTTNAFSLICTVVHPAYRLTLQTGAIYTGTCGLDFAEKAEDILDPIDASTQVIELLEEANDENEQAVVEKEDAVDIGTAFKSLEDVIDSLKKRISSVAEDVGKYIEWDSGTYVTHFVDTPGAFVVDDMTTGINYALMSDWAQAMFTSSWWDALVGKIAPEYGLEVLPTYDRDKLVVCPALPWKNTAASTVTIPDNGAFAVTLPGQDQNPVFGFFAYASTLAPGGGGPTVDSNGNEKMSTTPSVYAFVPEDTDKSTGRLQREQIPVWVDTARELTSMIESSDGPSQPGDSYSNELGTPREPSSGDNEQLKEMNPAVMMHLANRFILDYKSSVTGQLDCPLILKLKGKTLFPGQRLKFTAKGKAIFYGQIGSIVHEISCPESIARTQILLSHCTFAGGADSKVIGKNPTAPYYWATGSLEW